MGGPPQSPSRAGSRPTGSLRRARDRHDRRRVPALLDGPARGVRCALAVAEALRPLGLEVRAGLHTGEIELAGDDVHGQAVHIGARIAALAGAGEVLVSRTVRDLVVGSGLTFRDRGTHVLKGVPDEWQMFAAGAT